MTTNDTRNEGIVPGLGLYNRQKLSDNSNSDTQPRHDIPQIAEPADNIFSVDVQKITSQDMQGIKEAIISAHDQRMELRVDLRKIKLSLVFSKIKLIVSYVFLMSVFSKTIAASIKEDIKAKINAIEQLKEQIDNCYVKLDIEFEPDIKTKYDKVIKTFKNLTGSNRIWDITGAYHQDTRATRSAASTAVKKIDVKFGVKPLEDIKSQFETLWMMNANGADLYFYPNFIVMYSTQKKFALVGLNELELNHNGVRFVETGTVPHDSKIIDRTWAKVNKNGSPDKRFKDNYQIPIVKYGEINLSSGTGLNEEYQFSNYECSEEFAKAFSDYQKVIKSLKQIVGQTTEEH